MAARCYLTLAGALASFAMTSQALEALNEAELSVVTGQAQGLRLTSEFTASNSAISYHDDDGHFRADLPAGCADGSVSGEACISANAGVISMRNVTIGTPTNRPLVIDVQVEDIDGQTGLVFRNRDLAIDIDVASLEINGESLGRFGQNNFALAAGEVYQVELLPGGHVGNGLTLNMTLPDNMRFETFYEDTDGSASNSGGTFSSTVSFHNDATNAGLRLEGLKLDLEDDGLRVTLPEINNGQINFYNAKLGDDILNSVAYRNITLPSGSHALIKNARDAEDSGFEIDLNLAAGTAFDYVYIAGEVDLGEIDSNGNVVSASYGAVNGDIYEGRASFNFIDGVNVKNMRMNVDKERGLLLDFDSNDSSAGISTHLLVNNIQFQRTGSSATPATLGTIDAQVNLTNNTYLQVEGR